MNNQSQIRNDPRRQIIKEAEKNWRMSRLCKDISEIRGRKLTDENDDYFFLCGLLCGTKAQDLADIIYKTKGAASTQLSNGLYKDIKKLYNYKFKEEIEEKSKEEIQKIKKPSYIYIIKYLKELGYRKIEFKVILDIDYNEADIQMYIQNYKNYFNDPNLILERIEHGSVILVFKSSQEAFTRAREMFESGELAEVLGIPIQDVQLVNRAITKTPEEQEEFATSLLSSVRDEGYDWVELSDILNVLELVRETILTTQEAIETALSELLSPDFEMPATATRQGEEDLDEELGEEEIDIEFINALTDEVINFYQN